jgi:hypothetical protein
VNVVMLQSRGEAGISIHYHLKNQTERYHHYQPVKKVKK